MSALRALKSVKKLEIAREHYDLLHSNRTATPIFWIPNEKKWLKINDKNHQCIDDFIGLIDVYLTPNQFYGWRRFDLLQSLRACYIDIDRELSLYELYELIDDSLLPAPSLLVHSGRGWHLYWLIEPTGKHGLPQWQHMQDILIKAYGADPSARDCARVLRLVGTTNSKSNTQVTGMILDPVPWQFEDLCNEIIGYKKTAKILDIQVAKAERQHRQKTSSQSSIYAWWYLVYSDLVTIAESYGNNGIPHGHRNNFLHIVAVAMSWFSNPESIHEALVDRANKWTSGLTGSQIESAVKCSLDRLEQHQAGKKIIYKGREVDPRYHYRRVTLYNLLKDIIKPEIINNLRTIISEQTRLERRTEREQARDRVTEGRYKTRHRESLSQLKPWENEGISRRTWYRRNRGK